MKNTDFRPASTITEVQLSTHVVILDARKVAIQKDGKYNDLKSEWSDETMFYKRLRELLDEQRILIKTGK